MAGSDEIKDGARRRRATPWRRRDFLQTAAAGVAALAGAALLPGRSRAASGATGQSPGAANQSAIRALADTDVFYLTPLRADGSESRCQAEIWFAADAAGAYVVTAAEAWRARAVTQGLDRARIWVGDVGVWTGSDGRYRELPSMEARASLVGGAAEHQRVLELFGDKYPLQWLVWGPRFRKGLADGSRVLLHYRPA